MNSTAQHTPGPWRKTISATITGGQTIHRVTVDAGTIGAQGRNICHVFNGGNLDETEANARLIAAAPALLAALSALVENVDAGRTTLMYHEEGRIPQPGNVDAARAAIAQATGNTSTAEQPEEEDSDEAEENKRDTERCLQELSCGYVPLDSDEQPEGERCPGCNQPCEPWDERGVPCR